MEAEARRSCRDAGEIDIAGCATVAYSSEDPAHPVEHLFDEQSDPGATRWISARPDTTEHIVVEFDRPLTISRLAYEVEETMRERTQEVRMEVSEDGGRSYRQILVQEYNFSPGEPPISAKNRASSSARSLISASRLFQTRTAPPRRHSRRSASLRKTALGSRNFNGRRKGAPAMQ
jgi:hypothetical protein